MVTCLQDISSWSSWSPNVATSSGITNELPVYHRRLDLCFCFKMTKRRRKPMSPFFFLGLTLRRESSCMKDVFSRKELFYTVCSLSSRNKGTFLGVTSCLRDHLSYANYLIIHTLSVYALHVSWRKLSLSTKFL